jgi:Stage II sporulation protein E (SpoIIE)
MGTRSRGSGSTSTRTAPSSVDAGPDQPAALSRNEEAARKLPPLVPFRTSFGSSLGTPRPCTDCSVRGGCDARGWAAEFASSAARASLAHLGVITSMGTDSSTSRGDEDVANRSRNADDRASADRELLHAVQTGVLPAAPPSVDGVRLDAAYRMAGAAAGRLGGDFYVFVPFDDGSVGVGIGDVAGHGPAAVAAMANARLTLRAIAAITPDPSLALTRTELVLRRTGTLDVLSVLYGVIDPARGAWTHVNAGHLPAIVKRGDGEASVIEGAGSRLLGAGLEPSAYPRSETRLEPGDTLVLYTDGLIERRTEGIDTGIERLRALIEQQADVSALTSVLMDTLAPEPEDDVAIVVAQMDAVLAGASEPPSSGGFYRRRPSRVQARPAREGELVPTPLGVWVATSQDWIMTTQDGDRHLVPYSTFCDLYVEDETDESTPTRDGGARSLTHRRFAPVPESISAARRFVSACIRTTDVDRDVVVLLTSELATNAVVHAKTPYDVTIETSPSIVRVLVRDGSRHGLKLAARGRESETGRGLGLVASLASDWGADIAPPGKTVWFEVVGQAPSTAT